MDSFHVCLFFLVCSVAGRNRSLPLRLGLIHVVHAHYTSQLYKKLVILQLKRPDKLGIRIVMLYSLWRERVCQRG